MLQPSGRMAFYEKHGMIDWKGKELYNFLLFSLTSS